MSDERDDEDRRAILARRRRFVTIALASAGVSAVGCDREAPPCLSPIPEPTQTVVPSLDGAGGSGGANATGGAAPMPCLSPPMPPPDDAGTAGQTEEAPDAGAPEPLPTTKPKPPVPRVCLRIAPPPDWDKK